MNDKELFVLFVRILTVITQEPNCEFLKISTSDYARVMEQIQKREETEKVNLLQSCEAYKLWSKQPLANVANLIGKETEPYQFAIYVYSA